MEKKSVFKKIAAMSLAAVMLLAVAGCGGGEKKKEADGGNTAKIGLVTATTGGAAAYGLAIKKGSELAVEEINAKSKTKLALLIEDEKGVKNEAINAMNKLIHKDNVLVVSGPMLSGTMFAAGPIAQQAGVPALGTSTTAEGITDIGNFIFRNAVPESIAIPAAVEKAHKILGFKKVAIMYSNNNDMQVSVFNTYKQVFAKLGTEVVAIETFADKDTDYSAQLTKIQQLNPDILAVAALYQEGSLILKKARDMGMKMPVIGNNGFNSPEFMKLAGLAAEGAIVGSPWFPEKQDEKVQNFRKAFKAKYQHEPDQFSAQAYDGIYLLHAAIEKAGTVSDRKKVRDSLASIKDFSGVTGKFAFDDKRNPKMDINVLIVKGGKFVELK
ncbi:MAG: ABC transporter substrate-binding protein [Acholeplasmataceae bacterium]|nr:ABC transporter substrate-binding protein [Acidaminococcaceae bacterium]NLY84018.1 ABC transporter substrate-binding protein [Acholeplasmataceae bacterium]